MLKKENDITVSWELTLEEANLILKSLSLQPFKDVYELIGKLNHQANHQLMQNHVVDFVKKFQNQ